MATLSELIGGGAAVPTLALHLKGLDAAESRSQVLALGPAAQAKLFELAAVGGPLTAADFVPADASGPEVVFEGRNSMPVFSRFQKRFFRGPDGRVFGRNAQTFSFLTGPGYFEVVPSPRSPNEIVMDYTKLPASAPAGLPAVTSNDGGVAKLVFGGMHDYVRKVAPGVVIGWAFKDGKDLKTTFVLVR